MEYKYKIGDKTYSMKQITPGQIKQLEGFIREFVIAGEITPATIMSILGNNLPYALAIVLVEEGKTLADRFRLTPGERFGYEPDAGKMNAIALEIATSIDLGTELQVIEDFFVCNPLDSYTRRLGGLMGKVTQNLPHTGLTNSAPSSPEATSPGETISSGDTPS